MEDEVAPQQPYDVVGHRQPEKGKSKMRKFLGGGWNSRVILMTLFIGLVERIYLLTLSPGGVVMHYVSPSYMNCMWHYATQE